MGILHACHWKQLFAVAKVLGNCEQSSLEPPCLCSSFGLFISKAFQFLWLLSEAFEYSTLYSFVKSWYVCHFHKFTFKWKIPKVSVLWKAILSYCGGLHLENLLLMLLVTSKWVLNWQIWPSVKNSCVIQFLIPKIMSVLHLCSLCERFL